MAKRKIHLIVFVGSFILTLLLTAAVSLIWPRKETAPTVRLKQGFDFRFYRTKDKTLSEPAIGSKINLGDLGTSRGEKVSDVLNQGLLLLVVVDPLCPACDSSIDMMGDVRKTANEIGIKYLPVVFVKTGPDFDAQKYAETFGFETCLRWRSEAPAPEPLGAMVTPSHILTTGDGVILQIWFGSDRQEEVRKRMSEQISSDLFLINDVIGAIRPNDKAAGPQQTFRPTVAGN